MSSDASMVTAVATAGYLHNDTTNYAESYLGHSATQDVLCPRVKSAVELSLV